MRRFLYSVVFIFCLCAAFTSGFIMDQMPIIALLCMAGIISVSILGLLRFITANKEKFNAEISLSLAEIKVLEKELDLQKDYLTVVMNNSSEIMFIEDLDGNFLKVNQAFADYAGVSDPELCEGANVQNYFSPQLSSILLEDISNIAVTGVDSHFMLPVEDSLGKASTLAVHHSLLRNDKGDPVAIVGYARKIDSPPVEPANSLPFSFRDLCHELRTPFVGIIGSLKALNCEDLPHSAKAYAVKGLKSAERYRDALNDLLNDSFKKDAGAYDYDFFNPSAAFLKNIDIYISTETESEKSISFAVGEGVPDNILCSARGVSRALFGLVCNGISLMKGSSLSSGISVESIDSDEVEFLFWIKDSTAGSRSIREDMLSNYFKDAVNKIDGKIYFESQDELVFGFTVLAKIPVEKDIESEEASIVSKSILLAEDDMRSQIMMRKTLEQWGYSVRTASNGVEVLNCLQGECYDLVLMDIQMPEMDGYEAIKSIRKNESDDSKVPIIVMSAYGSDGDFSKMSSLGINEYISKPIKMDLLKGMISKYF